MKTLLFEAFDTLFFRDARPMESIGARPPRGRFPPQARTVAGAVRGCIGEAMNVDWPAYRRGEISQKIVEKVIGKAQESGIGALKLTGPYPVRDGERLYPLPLFLLAKRKPQEAHEDGKSQMPDYEWERLTLGKQPVECDIGKVYLVQSSGKLPGAKPLDNAWLAHADMQSLLSGEQPKYPIQTDELFAAEGRLGIGINHSRRAVVEGLLYQTVHARPLKNVAVGIEVEGLPADLKLDPGIIRLGGEGRFVGVGEGKVGQRLKPNPRQGWNGVLLMLLTPACFDEGCWHPPNFTEDIDQQGAKVWCGEIEEIKLTILSAVIGKTMREGGWDLANHRSRPASSLIPAGSVFFCTVEGDARDAVEALQGNKIGYETELGRGELAVGYWEGVQK
ncbi:MAG: type III-B CRISPR module-associated Cmr3 family protein [Methylococcaceae bacterium]|nr:type III-B CRISPR module-associated Cmr3 family protein [Methylococcaceae bacterium]